VRDGKPIDVEITWIVFKESADGPTDRRTQIPSGDRIGIGVD